MPERYKGVRKNGHPLISPGNVASTIAVCRFILYEKIGPGIHPCHWCGKLLTWGGRGPTSIQTDHIDAVKSHNDPSNLVAACKRCNNMRTRTGINRPVGDHEIFVVRIHPDGRVTRHRAELRYCAYCGSEFKYVLADKAVNKGRFCCRSHARRTPRKTS
jgi:hypothetical protein